MTRYRSRPSLALLLALACAGAAHARAKLPAQLEQDALAAGRVRVIVQLAPAAARWQRRARQDAALARTAARASDVRRYTHFDAVALEASAAELRALAAAPEVISLTSDAALAAPTLDSTAPVIGATAVVDAGFAGTGAAIAILDTGVDRTHPFFAGRIVAEACFSANGDCPNGQTTQIGPGAGDECGFAGSCFHGTHVAGIAAGEHAIYQGVAPGAQLVSIRIFSRFTGTDCAGTGYDPCALAWPSDILAGLDHVLTLRASLPLVAANMSFGSGRFTSRSSCESANPATKAALLALAAAGVAPVAASGNDSFTAALNAPACIDAAIAVGATHDDDAIWAKSNARAQLDFLAPGVTVRSAAPGGGQSYSTGTSMATPQVSGALAVLRQAAPNAPLATLVSALQSTGRPLVDTRAGANNLVRPRIQVDAAVKSLAPAACYDALDNDADGRADYPADLGCANGLDASEEYAATGCGIGPELALALPLLAALRRRRR